MNTSFGSISGLTAEQLIVCAIHDSNDPEVLLQDIVLCHLRGIQDMITKR